MTSFLDEIDPEEEIKPNHELEYINLLEIIINNKRNKLKGKTYITHI